MARFGLGLTECDFCGRVAEDVSTCDPKDGRDICGSGFGCLTKGADK